MWFFFRPGNLLAALLIIGTLLLYRRRLRWGRRFVTTATVAVLAIGFLPLAEPILGPLERNYPANPDTAPPDGIIVLGGAEQDTISDFWGQPSVNDAGDRFLAALILAHRFPEAKVIFTGGNGRLFGGTAGASIAEDLFLAAGLEADRLILEGRSRNTAENAVLTFRMTPTARTGRWILVTSAFHMHRAVASFCAAGWQNIVPWPVDFRTAGGEWTFGWRFAETLVDLNTGLREWLGILGYRVAGRVVLPGDAPGCLAIGQVLPEEALAGAEDGES